MNQVVNYEEDKKYNKDHVATPRWVVENIYDIINIKTFRNIWFPFNNYDSHFKLKADELNLKYKATHIFDDLGNDFFKTLPPDNCDLLISNPPFSQQNEIIKGVTIMIKLTDIQKENIVDHIMNSQVRCKRCSKYDGDRSDKADKKDVNYHCSVDTYDGRCWSYCFSEIYKYIESNNLWESVIKKHRIKNF